MSSIATPAPNPLAAPLSLERVHTHLLGTLAKFEAVEWQQFLPDTCCDEHSTFGWDEVFPAVPSHVTGMLTWEYVWAAKELGHQAGDGSSRAECNMEDVLFNALTGAPQKTFAYDPAELLAWARSVPVTTSDLLARAYASKFEFFQLGVRCEESVSDLRLALSETEVAHVRHLSADELAELMTLPD